MLISYNWLRDYFQAETNVSEIADLLTQTGLEVESCEPLGGIKGDLAGLVVGEVISKEKHPDADRLSVVKVYIGGEDILEIVCGATNIDKGQKVVVAPVGTTIYPTKGEPFTIQKSKIRGITSHGMVCAEDEIGLGTNHDGILVLDSSVSPGKLVSELLLPEKDFAIEIGLTPNRTDAMSHYGVARDLVAALKRSKEAELKLPSVDGFIVDENSVAVEVVVEDAQACPRYAGVVLSDVKVSESPEWLKGRLRAIGLQPINNVVDVTNFVLHECGQPLHAFDLDKIEGNKVQVKTLPGGTLFTTLDGVERKLNAEDLMICGAGQGMCIAGVFGGNHSGVKPETTRIFLESAFFNPAVVRKTAKRHGLNTDASFRFERGVDPNLVIYALKRAAMLMKEICGAMISSEIIDHYPAPLENREVEFSVQGCNRLLGQEIATHEMQAILESLEIEVLKKEADKWTVSVPAYRHDVSRHVDICEEILRIYGYNNISLPAALRSSISHAVKPDREHVQNVVSNLLVAQGYTEMIANSLTSSTHLSDLNLSGLRSEENVAVLSPLSQDLDVLRQSLLFGGLQAIAYNGNRQRANLKLFEFGKTYHLRSGKYKENMMVSLYCTGRKNSESWRNGGEDTDFFDIKGMVANMLAKLGVECSTAPSKHGVLAEGLDYLIDGKTIGFAGLVDQQVQKKMDVDSSVFYAEFEWNLLLEYHAKNRIQYSAVARFPEVRRDLSLLLDQAVEFAEIEKLAYLQESVLLKSVNLFDVYDGKNLPEGKKSYAVSFILQDPEKTLGDKEIDSTMSRIQSALQDSLGATLR